MRQRKSNRKALQNSTWQFPEKEAWHTQFTKDNRNIH